MAEQSKGNNTDGALESKYFYFREWNSVYWVEDGRLMACTNFSLDTDDLQAKIDEDEDVGCVDDLYPEVAEAVNGYFGSCFVTNASH